MYTATEINASVFVFFFCEVGGCVGLPTPAPEDHFAVTTMSEGPDVHNKQRRFALNRWIRLKPSSEVDSMVSSISEGTMILQSFTSLGSSSVQKRNLAVSTHLFYPYQWFINLKISRIGRRRTVDVWPNAQCSEPGGLPA